MIVKARGSVTVPRLPKTVGSIIPWCKDVSRALQQLRDRSFVVYGAAKARSNGCAFGDIVSIPGSEPAARGISGGIIYCAGNNWNMDSQEFSAASDGAWLVSIPVEVVANMDDDNEILLPGLSSGTRPTGDWTLTAWTSGTDYPPNVNPTIPDGDGTIKIPIGKLTITDGSAKFEAAACGNININHCNGTLSHTRG